MLKDMQQLEEMGFRFKKQPNGDLFFKYPAVITPEMQQFTDTLTKGEILDEIAARRAGTSTSEAFMMFVNMSENVIDLMRSIGPIILAFRDYEITDMIIEGDESKENLVFRIWPACWRRELYEHKT